LDVLVGARDKAKHAIQRASSEDRLDTERADQLE
jgi:hypothetical protein